MNIAKSKFQQIVHEELQRLIYEQTGYSGQGYQQKQAAEQRATVRRELTNPNMSQAMKDALKIKFGKAGERYTGAVGSDPDDVQLAALEKTELIADELGITPDFAKQIASVIYAEPTKTDEPTKASEAASGRPLAGTSPEAEAAFAKAGKRAKVKARAAQTKPTAEQERIAGKGAGEKEDRPFGSLESQEAWLDKETARETARQAALGAPGSGTGLGGQPAGTPSGIAPPTYQGKAATPGQVAAMSRKEKEGGPIGGGLSMKSMVPSAKELAPGAWGLAGKSAKLADKIGLVGPGQKFYDMGDTVIKGDASKAGRLAKASGKAHTPEERAMNLRTTGGLKSEHKLQNLNKLEQIVKEVIKETIYNKDGDKHS